MSAICKLLAAAVIVLQLLFGQPYLQPPVAHPKCFHATNFWLALLVSLCVCPAGKLTVLAQTLQLSDAAVAAMATHPVPLTTQQTS